MTGGEGLQRRPAGHRDRHRTFGGPRLVALVAVAIAIFAVGVALGQALSDGPPSPSTGTFVRTLEPLPQQPATTSP